jgi:protease I
VYFNGRHNVLNSKITMDVYHSYCSASKTVRLTELAFLRYPEYACFILLSRRSPMRLEGKTIATLVAEGVEDLEYYVPLMRLQEEGARVLTAAIELKPLHGKHGLEISPDIRIDVLSEEDLFALVVPGGWAPDKLRRYTAVKEIVRDMDSRERTIGIICHGGLVAISAGIMQGRRATGSHGIKDDIINAGGTWLDQAAFRDGNRVWGRVVADIPDFCRELVQALVERVEAQQKG